MCVTPDFKHHAFPAGGNVRRRFKLEGVRRHAAVGFPPYQDLPAFNAGSFLEPDGFAHCRCFRYGSAFRVASSAGERFRPEPSGRSAPER